ncbi:hypothetical protein C4J81_03570 [Deltaproteobacteria bacterium Smac51]|nr:hypothetical protein C4J81_03570 [Deltaproteobacteria bacterium Smac51]
MRKNVKKIKKKTMKGAMLALSAILIGLPAGPTLAAATDVTDTDSWSVSSIGADDEFNITGKVKSSTDLAMSGGLLTTEKLIFGAAAANAGELSYNTNKLTFTGGRIVADEISFSGSTANQLFLQSDGHNVVINLAASASADDGTINAKTLNYDAAAGWRIRNTTIQIADGGTFNLVAEGSTTTGGHGLMTYNDDATAAWNGHLNMTGGTLNMNAAAKDGTGKLAEFNNIDITGGTVNIGGYYGNAHDTFGTTTLYGNLDDSNHFKIGGNAVVNLYDYGTIAAYGGTLGQYSLDISGGAINALGTSAAKSSIIRAASRNAKSKDEAQSEGYATLDISGGKINVDSGKHGVILSRETNMTGGEINVDGSLIVAGAFNPDAGGDTVKGIKNTASKWGDFNFNGGTVTVGATGQLLFSEGMVLNAGDAKLNGKLVITKVNDSETANVAAVGTATSEKVKVGTSKNFTVSALHITKEALTKALDVAGKLTVSGALTTDADIATEGSIDINKGGSLVASLSEVLDELYALQDDNDTLNTALKGSEGLIYLQSASFDFTEDDMTAALAALGLDSGQVVFTNGTLVDEDGKAAEVVVDGDGSSSSIDVSGTTSSSQNNVTIDNIVPDVSTGTVTISGDALQSSTVTVNSDDVKVVEIQNELVVSGSGGTAGTALVSDASDNAVDLKLNDGAITLGVTGSETQQAGTVGNIEIASGGGTVNVNDGTFTTGAIIAGATASDVKIAVENSGSSDANAITTLTTDGIDLSQVTGDATVNLASAALTSSGSDIIIGGDISVTTSDGSGDVKQELTVGGGSSVVTGGGNIVVGGSVTGSGTDIVTHELTVADSSTVNTGSGNITFSETIGDNVLKVTENSELNANSLLFGDAAKNELVVGEGSSVVVGDLTFGDAAGGNTVTVGDDNGGASLVVTGVATLNGAIVFTDPAWKDTAPYEGTEVAISKFAANTIDGVLIAGQNSRFAVNTGDTNWLLNIVQDMDKRYGQRWTSSDLNAAFGIYSPILLDTNKGGIAVDQTLTGSTGTLPSAVDTVTFANNSFLAIDVTNVNATTAALASTGANSLKVQLGGAIDGSNGAWKAAAGSSQAALYLDNAKGGRIYTIFGGVNSLSVNNGAVYTAGDLNSYLGDHWTGDNLMIDSPLLTGSWSLSGNKLQVAVERNTTAVREIYPYLSNGMAPMVDGLISNGDNNTVDGLKNGGTDNAGILFVSRLFSDTWTPNHKDAARALEGAAQIAVAAGVPTLANNLTNQVSGLIVAHNSLLNETQAAYGNEPGKLAIWVTPFYGYSDVDGMDAGKFENGYEINYGGAALGLDYNISENFRLGLALNAGGGDTESQGDFYKTENDFDFWGVSLYGSYTNGAFGLTADLGYTGIDNELEQKTPAVGLGGDLKSNVDSDVFTVGLTGEYRFVTESNLNVTPHLGMRYTKISTDDASLKSGGRRVLDVETDDQNLFQIPLGVKFSGDHVTDGGWTISPSADIGVLFTMGDTDVDSKARITGTGYRGVTNSEVVDSAAFTAALGLKAKADNGLTLGLEYGLLASGNQTDHSVNGLLRFEF